MSVVALVCCYTVCRYGLIVLLTAIYVSILLFPLTNGLLNLTSVAAPAYDINGTHHYRASPLHPDHYITHVTRVILLGLTVTFTASLRKRRLKKTRQKKRAAKNRQEGRCYLLVSLRKDWKNLSCLSPSSCLLFFFVLSALNSPPPPSSPSHPSVCYLPILPFLIFPHLFLSLSTHLSPPLLCALLPHHPLTACHSVTLPHRSFIPTPSSLSPSPLALSIAPALSAPPTLPVRPHAFSQSTFAMRRCSCARTAGRATRTRSASVLQSLRGYCANTPAARQARTATPPPPRASPQPPCCSALC